MYLATARGAATELGQPAAVSRISAIRWRTAGTTDPANCCCVVPLTLGVGVDGTAKNRMELRFTIEGHRRGFEYDIRRNKHGSVWQHLAGGWALVGLNPAGADDDASNRDECLTPRNDAIFVKDGPGMATVLPAPPFAADFRKIYGPAAVTSAAADQVVHRVNFAEWVSARNVAEGVPWTKLAFPARADGSPRSHVFWHSVVWIVTDGAGNFDLDRVRSRISRGSLPPKSIDTAPV